jgi:hypothetical protein
VERNQRHAEALQESFHLGTASGISNAPLDMRAVNAQADHDLHAHFLLCRDWS